MLHIGEMRHQMAGYNNAGYILDVVVGSSGRAARPTPKECYLPHKYGRTSHCRALR